MGTDDRMPKQHLSEPRRLSDIYDYTTFSL